MDNTNKNTEKIFEDLKKLENQLANETDIKKKEDIQKAIDALHLALKIQNDLNNM